MLGKQILVFTGGIFFGTTCFFINDLIAQQIQTDNNFKIDQRSIIAKIESYVNGIQNLSASFSERNSKEADINEGHIHVERETKDNKTKVKISYETGKILSIAMNGRFLTVTERKTKKSRTYSILTTPIYALLAGKLNFSSLHYKIIEDTLQYVIVQITYEKQIITLSFRKRGDEVDKLLSWNIDNGNNWINIEMDENEYHEKRISKTKIRQ